MKISTLIQSLEELAPIKLQESYDNSGLIIGDATQDINQALITLDITEEVMDYAIENNYGLIIAHHPVVFSGLKKITGKNSIERIVLKAIKNDIAIYAIHTNLDNVQNGVNHAFAKAIGLKNFKILQPMNEQLLKLVCFCPEQYADKVRQAMFENGAGQIGNYDSCSFNTNGQGSFKAGENTNAFVGEKGKLHFENEIRIETIVPVWKQSQVIKAMIAAHPYEEVAYDIYPIKNQHESIGAGMIGELPTEMDSKEFLQHLKDQLNCGCVRHSPIHQEKVKKIAICGGSGSFLIHQAMAAGADAFVSGDIKYHQFFDAENRILIADVGHYESEQFTKSLLEAYLKEKFPNFAIQICPVNTNMVNYL